MRAFVAIPVSASGEMMKILSELGLWRKQGLRPVDPGNMHLTLKFLGEIDPDRITPITEALEKAVDGHGPFRISFRGMGVFPNERYIKVVWVGVESEPLVELAGDVIDSLVEQGFERSRFSPHLTLARVKSAKPVRKIRDILRDHRETAFGRQDVSAIFLIQSTLTPSGPIYDEIAKVELVETTGDHS